MQKDHNTRRLKLASGLLGELKCIYGRLSEIASEIETQSGSYYEKAFQEHIAEIRSEAGKFRCNVERVEEINREITNRINQWFEYVKDQKEMARLTFPLRYFLKKRSLGTVIRKLNEEVAGIAIENRFIKEQLTIWEHKLEVMAIQQIKTGEGYQVYEQLLAKREAVIQELKYLLPTIHGLCPADIGVSDIDALLNKLSSIEAA